MSCLIEKSIEYHLKCGTVFSEEEAISHFGGKDELDIQVSSGEVGKLLAIYDECGDVEYRDAQS